MITSITDDLVAAVVGRFGNSVEKLNLSSNGTWFAFKYPASSGGVQKLDDCFTHTPHVHTSDCLSLLILNLNPSLSTSLSSSHLCILNLLINNRPSQHLKYW
jgi:hypothetical protein